MRVLECPSKKLDSVVSKTAEAQAPAEAFISPWKELMECELLPMHPNTLRTHRPRCGATSFLLLTLPRGII